MQSLSSAAQQAHTGGHASSFFCDLRSDGVTISWPAKLPLQVHSFRMESLHIVAGVAVALLGVLFLFLKQRGQYAQHVSQLQPSKEKRSKPLPEFKVYTREEVAQHNKPHDAWIIVQDKDTKVHKVYDITEYVDEHPGGDAILNNVGGDATEGFYGPQHPPAVFVMVETYLIGKVEQ